MKKNLYPLVLAFLAASLTLFFACNKSSSAGGDAGIDGSSFPPEQTVTAGIQGRVVDENGLPVQGAAVSSGYGTGGGGATGIVTMQTDVNGVFSFSNIKMSSRFGYVKVTKAGYFAGSRSLVTVAGSSSFVSIQLIPRTQKGMVAASTGGVVKINDGDSVALPASGVVNATSGAAYTGNVKVYGAYLDPTASDLYKFMPGDLRGIGTNGKETALQSFGMLAVELEGDAGEKLQIAAGNKATLTWAIPAALQAVAPVVIPLWYFNDSTGRWMEQGTAARVGNNYVGQVGHFSYWNCDAPMGAVTFKVHLKDQHGNALAYAHIQFKSELYGTAGGYTDSSGFAQGLIPKGQTLVMQVLSECGNVLAGSNVGPTLTDQDLGTIIVTVNYADLILKGKVVDCGLNLVDSGFVAVAIDGLNYNAAVVKGAFTLPITRCYNSSTGAMLTAGDFKTAQQGKPVSVTVASGTADVGQLSACGTSIDQFIQFTVDGNAYNLIAPPDNINYSTYAGTTRIYGNASGSQSPSISLQFSNLTGTTGSVLDSVYVSTPASFYTGAYINCTITAYGPVNGYIQGNFDGPVNGTSGKTISGSFKVKRTN